MKTLSNTLWITGSVIVVAGAFFKIMHYQGSALILMTGLLTTAAGFLMMFITRNKTKAS